MELQFITETVNIITRVQGPDHVCFESGPPFLQLFVFFEEFFAGFQGLAEAPGDVLIYWTDKLGVVGFESL